MNRAYELALLGFTPADEKVLRNVSRDYAPRPRGRAIAVYARLEAAGYIQPTQLPRQWCLTPAGVRLLLRLREL